MTEPEPAPEPPASKKPRGCRVVLIETTPGEMARKTSMLFCSSVATEGSVMPAMFAVVFASSLLKAAVGCCRRAPQRSKQATPAAAKSADSTAMARICLADIRYMALFLDDFMIFQKDAATQMPRGAGDVVPAGGVRRPVAGRFRGGNFTTKPGRV